MRNLKMKNIKSYHSLSLAKANASRDLQINFNQAEDALTIPAESRHDYKCGSTTQSGRSMIEMLGVLAIIGVLSVCGIAGYSKAMMKYRINKTIEQITIIAGNVRTFFAPQGNYDGLDSLVDTGKAIIKKAKLVPDEMWNSSKTAMENVFGGLFSIYAADKSSNHDGKAFTFEISGLPQEACLEIVSMDWKGNSGGNIMEIAINKESSPGNSAQQYFGNCTSTSNDFCVSDMPINIESAIGACKEDSNLIGMKFY